MALPLTELLSDFSANPGAAVEVLQAQEKLVGVSLPEDYREFLLKRNGGEGFVGKHYLILWKTEELFSFNRDYEVVEYAPGLLMFGSDGGGEGFAFDTRSTSYSVVEVPFIGMSLRDARPVAENFTQLLQRMFQTERSLF